MKELLSPAGNMESLKAAIHGGADAIYIGMKNFGARKFANNFDDDELIEAVKICHLYGVKLYVTMNTVIKDNEVEDFLKQVSFLYNSGVDAFIMQDFGMINLVLNTYPDIEIHASTQFNNSGIETIKLLKKMGVKRVVLSRELSLDEINKIDVDIEKEVFIHGALCVSYSGNCYFSSLLGSRSGNRGECVGCCRLPYKLYKNNKLLNDGYLLSTKELNTSDSFDELLNSDIKSFKIEGRMKSAEYVYFITKFYRNIIDGHGFNSEDLEILKILFNREFTRGNLFSDLLINSKTPNHIGLKIGNVVDFNKDKIKIKVDRDLYQEDGIRFFNSGKGMITNFLYNEKGLLVNTLPKGSFGYIKNSVGLDKNDDIYLTSSKKLSASLLNYPLKKIPVSLKFIGHVGEQAKLYISDGKNDISVCGFECQCAQNMPVTENRIMKQLSKLGNTVYTATNIEVDISDNLFIPMSSLNNLRQSLTKLLDDRRCSFKRSGAREVFFDKLNIKNTNYDTVIVDNEKELLNVLDYKRIYISSFDVFNKYKNLENIYYIEKRNTFNNIFHERSLVSEFVFPNNYISDYTFNVTNIYSVYYLLKLGYNCVTLSVELTDFEISSLIQNFYQRFSFYPNVEVIGLDKIEIMIIKGNVLNIDCDGVYSLKDIKNRVYPVYYDGVNTHIYQYDLMKHKRFDLCNNRYHYKYLK